MKKIKILYFSIQNFNKENLIILKDKYQLKILKDPNHIHKIDISKYHVIFAPLGFYFGSKLIDLAINLKIIASNTTGINHIDSNYANKK
ncbi:hypothetical protein OAQ96_01795, partial [Alphaproteobacteria bacterium]|nr:hypothetical protein [Alphaproteobacteria bacterium]